MINVSTYVELKEIISLVLKRFIARMNFTKYFKIKPFASKAIVRYFTFLI